jgi:lipid-A-disaccharide synthase
MRPPDASPRPAPHFALVAGEASGDNLGAGLIHALRERIPDATFAGVAGPRMRAAGCELWAPSESLAVMGLAEVVKHLPRLIRLRRMIRERLLGTPPAVFVGIDAPEFNLGLAGQLKLHGIPTVQYVSPQVWAWRQGRVRRIAAAVDLVLCLLPFERVFYEQHQVAAEFVGHPLADLVPLVSDRSAARATLGIAAEVPCIAVLPGSRAGEVGRLGPDFAATVAWLKARLPQLETLAPMANAEAHASFARCLDAQGVGRSVRLLDGQAQLAMTAADAVLVASGTATLEATLVKRPMVVAYRLSGFTTFLLHNLKFMKAPYFAQPNLLAGRLIVPEFFGTGVRGDVLGPAMVAQLERPDRAELEREFTAIHQELRRGASDRAAAAIVALLARTAEARRA